MPSTPAIHEVTAVESCAASLIVAAIDRVEMLKTVHPGQTRLALREFSSQSSGTSLVSDCDIYSGNVAL